MHECVRQFSSVCNALVIQQVTFPPFYPPRLQILCRTTSLTLAKNNILLVLCILMRKWLELEYSELEMTGTRIFLASVPFVRPIVLQIASPWMYYTETYSLSPTKVAHWTCTTKKVYKGNLFPLSLDLLDYELSLCLPMKQHYDYICVLLNIYGVNTIPLCFSLDCFNISRYQGWQPA